MSAAGERGMVSCRQASRMLSDAMEHRLAPMAWLKLRLHLAMCGMCRAYAGDLRILKAALGRLHDQPVGLDGPGLSDSARTRMLEHLVSIIDAQDAPPPS